MIKSKKYKFKVISTSDNWFGVTYKEDKPIAQATIMVLLVVFIHKLWE